MPGSRMYRLIHKHENSKTTAPNLYCVLYMVHCNFVFVKLINKPLNSMGRRLNWALESSYLKSCRSSLQSHLLKVTLYSVLCTLEFKKGIYLRLLWSDKGNAVNRHSEMSSSVPYEILHIYFLKKRENKKISFIKTN